MKNDKEHLDIDLEFLDKKEPLRVTPKPEPPKGNEPNWRYYDPNNVNPSSSKKYNWKSILIIGGIILFVVWAISSGSDSTSSSATTSSGTSTTGQYHCSQYFSDQADKLLPSPSEGAAIDNEYVDEYSQASIDRHNARIDAYNTRVRAYNDYLAAHCSR